MENFENISRMDSAEDISTDNSSEEEKPLDFEEFRIAKVQSEIAEQFPGYGEAVSAGVEKAMKKGVLESDIKEQVDSEYNRDGLGEDYG